MRKINIPKIINKNLQDRERLALRIGEIRDKLSNINGIVPDVSIVIPAYNEESTILQTLASISETKTKRKVEVIVVDNNSSDLTELLVCNAGVRCLKEGKQGYRFARDKGLFSARGKYVLNADADTLYPPEWIDLMIDPFERDESTVMVYGQYAFLPSPKRNRVLYYFYELFSDLARYLSKKIKDEAAFVMGANSGYIRERALEVNGYQHPPGANEDG